MRDARRPVTVPSCTQCGSHVSARYRQVSGRTASSTAVPPATGPWPGDPVPVLKCPRCHHRFESIVDAADHVDRHEEAEGTA